MRRLILMLALVAAAIVPAACGKKPAAVDAPQGEDSDQFPRTYPSE